MAVRLPKFDDTRCCFLTVCGQIVTEDQALIRWLAKQKPIEARYRASGRSAYLLAAFGGESSKHLHIDVAVREYFRGTPPKPSKKVSDIRQALKKVEGQKIKAEVEGLYRLSQDDLPSIVRATMVETRAGQVSLKTTGGTFGVDGAPIYELRWWIPGANEDARMILAARSSTTVSDAYLEDCFALVEAGFKAITSRNQAWPQ